MNKNEYLELIDNQLREAKDNMDIAEKSYREAKAKHKAMMQFKQSYITWVVKDNERD